MDTLISLPPQDLHDSPFQPRTVYTDIAGLAATIVADGRIHSPLLVRPCADGGHELVFGHRRKRAAIMAGLALVPCMLRTMTDAEVRAAQMTENLSRDNMLALEESAGYRAQIDHDGLTREEIAKRIGKSVSHVTARLRLLTLCPEVRTALEAGDIQPESALLVARVGDEKMQRKALGYIKAKYFDLEDGGARSYRQVRELLNERFTLDLDKALFDPADFTLLPAVGNCLDCPKRSGNAPEFADVAGQLSHAEAEAAEAAADADGDQPAEDMTSEEWMRAQRDAAMQRRSHVRHGGKMVCTDPDCFDAKKKAHLRMQASQLTAKGETVVDGNKARQAISARGEVKGAYIAAADVQKALAAAGAKAAEVKPVIIQDPRDGKTVPAYRRDDLQAAGVAIKATPASSQQSNAERQAQERAQRQQQEAEAKAESESRYALLLHVRQAAAARPRDLFEARMAAAALLQTVGYNDKQTLMRLHDVTNLKTLQQRIDTLPGDELAALMLDCLIVDNVMGEHWRMKEKPAALLALASHYGINAKAVMAASQAPAAAAAKQPATKAAKGVMYRDAATGQAWSGRGLQPAWLKAALSGGRRLEDFLTSAPQAAAEVESATCEPAPTGVRTLQ